MSITKEKIEEEFDRHFTFSKGFFAIILSLSIPIYLIFSYYKIGSIIFSFIMYFISSFFPDAFFVFMGGYDPKRRGYKYWRKISHSFSTSIVYFIFVTFLSAPIFGQSCFVIGILSLIGYWVHLFVDKIEIIEAKINSILDKLLPKVFK